MLLTALKARIIITIIKVAISSKHKLIQTIVVPIGPVFDCNPNIDALRSVEVVAVDVCCQTADTKANSIARVVDPTVMLMTVRFGNGFTSISSPSWSISECQPGKVANRSHESVARTTLPILYMINGFF